MFNESQKHPCPQAKSLGYFGGVYGWHDVEVISYDHNRFLVKLVKTQEVKHVIRLSLIFNFEDQQLFFNRLNLAKNLMNNAADDLRFVQYINQINDTEISKMSATAKENILSKVKFDEKFKQYNSDLIDEVLNNYSLNLKKSIVLKQMQSSQNFNKFHLLRISIRKPLKLVPIYGTVRNQQGNYEYKFKTFKDQVNKL